MLKKISEFKEESLESSKLVEIPLAKSFVLLFLRNDGRDLSVSISKIDDLPAVKLLDAEVSADILSLFGTANFLLDSINGGGLLTNCIFGLIKFKG